MQSRLRASGLLVFAMMGATIPAVAQTVSKSRQITIVAIMPETLKLSINTGAALAMNPKDAQGIATTASTAWSLGAGRANVVIHAYVKPLVDPAFIAGGPPSGTFPRHMFASSTPTDTMVTSANRRNEATACLPSSAPAHAFGTATPAGTLKIQVQPVL